MKFLGSLTIVLGVFADRLVGQGVIVAPHAVVIDHRTRSAAITLYNPGAEPAEVAISMFFGFPVTDSLGEYALATPAGADSQSAATWIEAYPRRMVIGPLQRQTVRLLARAPAGLAPGEYWSRILIAAKGGAAPVAVTDSVPGIEVGLSLEVRTIIPLQYRAGSVNTGVRIERARAVRVADSLVIRAMMTRTGNAAFIGTASGILADGSGRVVGQFAVPISVYRQVDPRFVLPVAGLTPGRYRLSLTLATTRTDLPAEQLLGAPASTSSIDIDLR